MRPIPGYNVRKAAQVAAFFAKKQGGAIGVLKLVKLIYLADREFIGRYDAPILYDKLVSMDHGPVDSITYDFINGTNEHPDWDRLISDRAGYSIGLVNGALSIDDLSELSAAELRVMSDVWNKFGGMDKYAVRDYTHHNCPEWRDPHGSSEPIPYERLFESLGKGKDAKALAAAIEEDRAIATAF